MSIILSEAPFRTNLQDFEELESHSSEQQHCQSRIGAVPCWRLFTKWLFWSLQATVLSNGFVAKYTTVALVCRSAPGKVSIITIRQSNHHQDYPLPIPLPRPSSTTPTAHSTHFVMLSCFSVGTNLMPNPFKTSSRNFPSTSPPSNMNI